ncbi:MAG: elongation factor EF-2 [Candidatus Bathyarchaeia archaeon]
MAHVDHGKCVSGDTLIPLSDGRIASIGELFNAYKDNPSKLWVDSFNPSTLKIEDRPASFIWRLKSDRLISVKLDNGLLVKTTPEHPFCTLNGCGLVEYVKAEDLHPGDYVAVAKVLKSQPYGHAETKRFILKKLSSKEYYLAYLSSELAGFLRDRIHKLGLGEIMKKVSIGSSKVALRNGIAKGMYRLNELVKLAEFFDIPLEVIYDNINYMAYRSSRTKVGKLSKKVSLPKSEREFLDLAYLVGLLFGDGGDRASFHNSSEELIRIYRKSLSSAFKVGSKLVRSKASFRVDHQGGLTLIKFLEDVFDYHPKLKSHNLKFPETILTMENRFLAKFVSGLFDTDGSVEKARRAVSLTTASKGFAKELTLALLRFKIRSILRENGQYTTLYISGENARMFRSTIGFARRDKSEALDRISREISLSCKESSIPLASESVKAIRLFLGLPKHAIKVSYYNKYEDGKARITRPVYKKIVDSLIEALPEAGNFRSERIRILKSIKEGGLDQLSRNIGVLKVNGILSQLKHDGLIASSRGKYKLSKYGRMLLEAWERAAQDPELDENVNRMLNWWKRVAEADVSFIKVAEKRELTGEFEVFDLTVPSTDSFVANGVIIHNTTMSDSLLAAAGLLSPSLAGTALALDYMEEEQKRQMTIKAANASLLHVRGETPYVINLIDTPGHVDFSGRVTRSLRAIDGAVVVVDAVEEVMVQTETVTRQAVEERVRPVLYINKIDRLIKELKLTSEQIQEKISRIIRDFNNLVEMYAEPEFKDVWKVGFAENTVAMGSAKDRWGFTYEIAREKGIKFADIVDAYTSGEVDELRDKAPLHEAILNMVVEAMPPPHVAQKYRIPKIWTGRLESEAGEAMINCSDEGPAVMCVTNIVVDPQAGVVATGRLFSGTIHEGDMVYLINANRQSRVQQVCIYMGPYREVVGSLGAGNIPALLGLQDARAGETIATTRDVAPFEAVRYVTEPVVTIAVEPKNSRDLPKLVDVLRKLSIEDPNLVTTINEETGEYLISGMGTLHLEIATTLIEKTGLEIVTSRPIVIYREAIRSSAGPFEGKSPNRHNKIYIVVEPLGDEVIDLMKAGKLGEYMDKHAMAEILRGHGWPADEARGVWSLDPTFNVLVDATKGAQYLHEARDMIIAGFRWAIKEGPLAYEQIRGLKAKIVDVSLHEDPVHRGPAQIMPMTRRAIFAAFLSADPCLLEPIQKITVKVPPDLLGAVTSVITQKRGRIISVEQKEHLVYVTGELPTAETFDLSEILRSATAGRAFWGLEFSRWAPVPASMMQQVIRAVRERKGLSPEHPKPEDFAEKA